MALDESLDVDSVKDQTGCTDEDYAELCRVFIDEGKNMMSRLQDAENAILQANDAHQLSDASNLLYTAAHELSASFAIIGARSAETYARETQVQLRHRAGRGADATPPKPDLLKATHVLLASIKNCLALLR
jgi:hypothetical protein